MDIIQFIVPGASPSDRPRQVYVTINGSPDEITAMMAAAERALSDGPQTLEVTSATGAPVRIIIDRLGAPLPKQ